MFRVIPIAPGAAHQTLTVQLDQESFDLELRWNGRAGTWFLDISDSEGTIVAGRPVMVGAPILFRLADRRLPKGELIAIDTSGHQQEATLDDIGTRVKLFYMDASTK